MPFDRSYFCFYVLSFCCPHTVPHYTLCPYCLRCTLCLSCALCLVFPQVCCLSITISVSMFYLFVTVGISVSMFNLFYYPHTVPHYIFYVHTVLRCTLYLSCALCLVCLVELNPTRDLPVVLDGNSLHHSIMWCKLANIWLVTDCLLQL